MTQGPDERDSTVSPWAARARTFAPALRSALHPPVRERGFWIVQAMVLVLAGLHLLVDTTSGGEQGPFPGGIPVALLIVPVGYAALRYGLAGSAATGIWATLLWLPDLLLPFSEGHAPSDIVNLALVDAVAFFIGQQIEVERQSHARAERATAARLSAEARYRQLFEANRAPILVLGPDGTVSDANPAAVSVLGARSIGATLADLTDGFADARLLDDLAGRVLTLRDGRDYRVRAVSLPPEGATQSTQVVFEDVTEERSESRRAARYAALMVSAEENQRRRLARELHDEPLQLFLHLARRLENLSTVAGVPAHVATSLDEARVQSLDAATRLRDLARDLRPPALDQLGLVAAMSSFLAEAEEGGLDAALEVAGDERRLDPDIELGAFRIVQEAVRNTLRHAHAQRVQVRVAFDGGCASGDPGFEPPAEERLVITVADDGCGFSGTAGDDTRTGHFGILGMTERANLIGGRVDVRSAPGRGTVVRAVLPVGGSAAVWRGAFDGKDRPEIA